jgi:hypothetical protein
MKVFKKRQSFEAAFLSMNKQARKNVQPFDQSAPKKEIEEYQLLVKLSPSCMRIQ